MASSLIGAIDAQAERVPNKVAFGNSRGETLTYAQLKRQSDALACWMTANASVPVKAPLVVYGHKSPLMLVCFMACVKSGHAYVPIDVVYPRDRVANIIDQLGPTAVFDTIGTIPELLGESLLRPCFDVAKIIEELGDSGEIPPSSGFVGLNDTFYILFTSGSTGTPKGVQVTTECVDNFSKWMLSGDYAVDEERVWFNRSPFTFDVSLTDIAAGLTHGDTLFALEDDADKSMMMAFEALGASDATEWVSTPSFVDQCLADESFNASLMPHLKRMLLAGEVLRPETVRLAQKRFPGLRVFNGYGPTESTDLVTLCEILPSMLTQERSLPIGYAKPDSQLIVLDPETLEPVPDGEHGELFVIGNTVAVGYWQREDLTEAAFGACPEKLACGQRSYRTGDEVTRDEDGLYYYHGRYDLQIKLHGYRIELGDIEATLCSLPEIHMACVLPRMRDGAISHLVAFIVLADPNSAGGFALTKQIKASLREIIPSYMVPRAFKYVDAFPLNPSGKADRKALAALIDE